MTVSLADQALITRYDGAVGVTLSAWARRERSKALHSLARWAAPVTLSEVTADHLARWLGQHTPRTRDLWQSHTGQFFAWAMERRVRKDDPAAELRLRGKPATRAKPAAGTLEHLAFAWIRECNTAGRINNRTAQQRRGVVLSFVEAASSTDPAKVTKRDVIRWLVPQEKLCTTTRRAYFSTVRQFLGWLVEERHLHLNPMLKMRPPAEVRTAQVALDVDQVGALLAACRDDREMLIVVLSLHTGLRRAELAAVDIGDISLSGRTLLVRKGKGGHGRIVPLAAEACEVLARYLAENGLTTGPLLRSLRYQQDGICGATVGLLVRQVALEAGVKLRPGDGVGTHSFRRTMATDVYVNTRDVMVVRDLLGHAQLSTTERYIKGMATERMREAVEGRSYLPSSEPSAAAASGSGQDDGGVR